MSGKKNTLYKSKQQIARSECAEFLRTLADRIESGSVTLTGDDGDTTVAIPEHLKLEVEYQSKMKPRGEQFELELELTWGPKSSTTIGLA